MHQMGGMPQMAMPQRETIMIPDNCVGLVIGRGGDSIKNIMRTTNVDIQVSQQAMANGGERSVELRGPEQNRGHAKAMIFDIVNEALRREQSGTSGGHMRQFNQQGGMPQQQGGYAPPQQQQQQQPQPNVDFSKMDPAWAKYYQVRRSLCVCVCVVCVNICIILPWVTQVCTLLHTLSLSHTHTHRTTSRRMVATRLRPMARARRPSAKQPLYRHRCLCCALVGVCC
jgi:hypothetical protein